MLPDSLYRYVWQTSRGGQIRICLLIALIAPLSAAPLELQRRIVDQAVGSRELTLLAMLGGIYFATVLLQGGLKYLLNLGKGRVLEMVTRDLRRRVLDRENNLPEHGRRVNGHAVHEGTLVSVVAAESEDVGGFASESLAVPLLQAGAIAWVLGYLMWVEPAIAALAMLVYAPQAVLVPRVQALINRLARTRTSMVRNLGHDAVAIGGLPVATRRKKRERALRLVERIFQIRLRIYRHKFFLTFLGNFLDSLGPIIVLTAGGYLVIHDRTDVSTLVVFISGFQKLSDPWDQLINFYRSVSTARVSYALVADVLNDERTRPQAGGRRSPAPHLGS